MSARVIRFRDYERRSREPDAVDRDPTESATIIILPVIRIERYAGDDEPRRPPAAPQLESGAFKMNLHRVLPIALACFALAFCSPNSQRLAGAQVATPGLPLVPLGYCQLTSIDASTLVSTCAGGIPAGANVAYFAAEAQAVRWRDDGTAPSTTVGMPLAVGGFVLYVGTLSALRVISQVAGAKLNVLFYKSP